jgi:hypothetical protein
MRNHYPAYSSLRYRREGGGSKIFTLKRQLVLVEISGGLGNQLFQLAAAEYLKKHGLNVLLDFRMNKISGTRENRIASIAEDFGFKSKEFGPVGFWVGKIPFFRRVLNLHMNRILVQENIEFHCPPIHNGPKSITYRGYWQTTQVAVSIKRKLTEYLGIGPSDLVPRIAVHVRRGDYLLGSNPSFHGVLHGEYYIESVKRLRDVYGFLPVMVFTDSPEIVKNEEWVKKIINLEFFNSSGDLSDFEEIAKSSGIVCSNSTFSWWASYISPSSAVTLPSQWQVGLELPTNLIQDAAIIVESSFVDSAKLD